MKYDNFQKAYYGILKDVLETGNKVTVRSLNMIEKIPYYFEIKNPADRLLNIKCRKNIRRYIFGELLWYLSGRDDVEFIAKYSKLWPRLSDDGIHNNSAYGKYIFGYMPVKGWGVNYGDELNGVKQQWEFVKEVLRKDPYSRQAVIHIKPVQMYETKDVTCTFMLHFFIRDNKLDLITTMRSNDLLFGTTYDVFMFTFLQELMAAELGVELGTYKHFTSNMHIYEKDMEVINNILNENAENVETYKFFGIPADFRQKDLPILLEIEQDYFNKCFDESKIEQLSPIGKQLVSFLIGDEDNE